jgi:hypothetical protein
MRTVKRNKSKEANKEHTGKKTTHQRRRTKALARKVTRKVFTKKRRHFKSKATVFCFGT